MKMILIIIIGLISYASDSTKVKPNFRYRKVNKDIDSLEYKIQAIQMKIDSLKNKRKK